MNLQKIKSVALKTAQPIRLQDLPVDTEFRWKPGNTVMTKIERVHILGNSYNCINAITKTLDYITGARYVYGETSVTLYGDLEIGQLFQTHSTRGTLDVAEKYSDTRARYLHSDRTFVESSGTQVHPIESIEFYD